MGAATILSRYRLLVNGPAAPSDAIASSKNTDERLEHKALIRIAEKWDRLADPWRARNRTA
jgi:hypothetical protein